MLVKVVSGGQTGADQAGLKAAQALGLATGGWVPKGCRTLDGPSPWLVSLYDCREHTSDKYPPRTYANVRDSDATLRFAKNWHSPGERCTLKAIQMYHKPYLDIPLCGPPNIKMVWSWLNRLHIHTLNIAGNSTRTCPGIEEFTFAFLTKLFKRALNSHVQN